MMTPDSDLNALKTDPQAAKLLSDPAGLRALLASPETKQLMELLQRSGGDLSAAAKSAAQGRPEALKGILDQVMSSAEGSRAVEELRRRTEQ